jgi:Fur family peroxide stress response transcriptional regulator
MNNTTNASGQRNTIQRKIILDALRKMGTHPTIEELYAEVSKEYSTISKTTVYRNLRILAQNGLVLRISLPDGLERYDGQTYQHYHFQCNKCEKIFDVEIPYLKELEATAAQKYDFEIVSHDIVFNGYCRKCRN